MRVRIALLTFSLLAVCAGEAAATGPPGPPGQIVFTVFEGPGIVNDLYLMNPDGSDRRPLTPGPGSFDLQPQFSSDGRTVFFSRSVGGDKDIYSINVDGSGLRNLTNTPGAPQEDSPAPSPDGTMVAYDESIASEFDIWVARADGSAPVNVTNTPVLDEAGPSFSPDGRLIAFARCNGQCEIWVMNPDGTGQRPVGTEGGQFEVDPAFSRDGRKIAFQTCPGVLCDIGVINLDGSGRLDFTDPMTDDQLPSFTADDRIGFGRCDSAGNVCDIFSMAATGGAATAVTNTPMPTSEYTPDFHAIQRCGKRTATIVGDDGPDKLKGTKRGDVIDANAGRNKVNSGGGNDTICAGKKSRINCGGGKRDRVVGKFKKAKNCERGKGLR